MLGLRSQENKVLTPKESLIKYPGFLRAPLCTLWFKVFDGS
jgi:hypothetical protein